MKPNKLRFAAVLALVALAGCKNEDPNEHHFDNKLYISTSSFTDELLIKGSVAQDAREIIVGVAKPVPQDITVKLAAAPELLDHYRKAYYDPQATLLDQAHYAIEEPVTEIKAGSVSSMPVKVEFLDINQLDREMRYVLPVTIASVSGIDVLASARTIYYVFKGAALINVVCDLAENRAYPDWKDGSVFNNLTEFTLEALIYPNAFGRQISTIMGIEGHFLIRIGDAGVPDNQLQVASSTNQTSADCKLETGQWTHVAVTFSSGDVAIYLNGVKKHEGYCGRRSVNFGAAHTNEDDGSRCFWIGYSYAADRYFDGRFAECRIWKKVLTAEEINAPDHFYQVDPASEGLAAYWKFDEGAGTTAKDYSANGNDLTIEKMPRWVSVSLPESNK